MKKLGLVTCIFLLVSVFAVPAQADQRITLSTSRPLVVMGSESVLAPSPTGVSDSGLYDWSTFRYEVLLPSVTGMSLSFRSSRALGLPCPGTQTNVGSSSVCEGFLSGSRSVLEAGNTFQSIGSSTLGLRARASVSFGVQVTGWLDSNRDGQISPLEPRSPQRLVTFIPLSSIAATINFQVDPAGRQIGSKTAWLSDSSGREGWGRNLNSVLEIDRFRVLVERCVTATSACSRAEYFPSYQAHPQNRAWRFDLSSEWAGNELTTVRLAYFETGSDFTVVTERVFDYRGEVPSSILTSISGAALGNRATILGSAPTGERWTPILDTSPSFQYSAVFRKSDGSALANENVDLRIDATMLTSINGLSIDGRPMSELTDPSAADDSRDSVWISRRTDSQGRVSVEMSDASPIVGQSVAIEARLRGYEPHFGGRGGFIERVFWQASKRSVSLAAAIDSSGRGVTLTTLLSGRDTFGQNRPVVRFQSSNNLLVRDSVQVLAGMQATNRVLIRFGSIATGSEVVIATVTVAGETLISELRLSFDAKTGRFERFPDNNARDVETSISSSRGKWTVRVQNARGLPVSVRAGSSWHRFEPTSDDFLFTRSAPSGKAIPIAVYVNGKLENVATIAIR